MWAPRAMGSVDRGQESVVDNEHGIAPPVASLAMRRCPDAQGGGGYDSSVQHAQ